MRSAGLKQHGGDPGRAYYQKMTESPVARLIIQLSIPSIISMMISNIYNMVDTAFVGRLGTSASAAVGIVFGFMAILQAVGFLFGQGSGSILGRKLGQQEIEEASAVVSTGFFSSLLIGFLIEIGGLLCLDTLAVWLGSTPTILPYTKIYMVYILLSSPFMIASCAMNTILRYEGKALFAMIGMMSGAVLNIFGDIFFMFALDMGIAGAGLSTALSQLISFCILVSPFLKGKTQCCLSFKRISHRFSIYLDIFTTGLPSMSRQALTSISTILLNMEAGTYGDAAVAAMSIVSRIMFFVFAVALGIGQGFQPVCGFNYGAGKYERVRKAYRVTLLSAAAAMIFLTVIVMLQPGDLLRLFRDDQKVIQIGIRALKLQALAQLVLPVCMAAEMLYQSTGKKIGALLLSVMRNGLFMIPVLLILSRYRGLAGIQEAYPVACLLSLPPSMLLAKHFFQKLPPDTE